MLMREARLVERCVVLVSFEGPDWYAWRGGLGERVVSLAAELDSRGWLTHHVYLGDPGSPAVESVASRLVLHRWAQWLSARYPGGVYEGEDAKAEELARSLPAHVLELIQPVLETGGVVSVIAEEWQTAPFVVALAEALHRAALDPKVELVWRAGSTFGWERVEWDRLAAVATIAATTPELCRELEARGVPAKLLPADAQATIAGLAPLPDRAAPPAVPIRPTRRRAVRDAPAR